MKVAFADMYSGFHNDIMGNPISRYFAASPEHQIVSPNDNPDLIIASVFGNSHTRYREAKKILWSGENIAEEAGWRQIVSFDDVDWSMLTNDPQEINLPKNDSITHYFVPYGMVHYDIDEIEALHQKNIAREKKKFCCFVCSNAGKADGYQLRNSFFSMVNNLYQKVDSAGRHLNNTGTFAPRGDDYFNWVSEYKFMICFENSAGPGYLTEKIFTPYASGTIPIYWGDKSNYDFIRREAGIFFTTPTETLQEVMKLDADPERYNAMLQEQLIYDTKKEFLSRKRLYSILDSICEEMKS